MLSGADWRADAGDERGPCIWTSSTGRSCGLAQTSFRSSGMWCRRCPPSPPGGRPADGCAIRRRAASADVRFLPSVGMSRNRNAGGVRHVAPRTPCRTSRNAARRPFRDANLALFQAQGRLPSLADLRADAGDERAVGMWSSSIARSSGAVRTWRRRSGMSSVGGTARVAPAGVRFLPSVGTSRNRSAEGIPCSLGPGTPRRISRNAAARTFWER
jgi:hypothetical protein